MTWTDEAIAQLKALWADGMTASKIAATLRGVTRNAVLGKLHRLGLARQSFRPRPQRKVSAPPRAAVRVETARAKARKPAALMAKMEYRPPQFARGTMATIEAEASARPLPQANPLMRTFMQLQDGECRYPYGEDAPFLFCAQPVEEGKPYCAAHCAVCFTPVGAPPQPVGDGRMRTQESARDDDGPRPLDQEIVA